VRPRLFALLLGAASFAASPVQSSAPFDPAGKWLITTIDELGTPVSIGLDISGKPGAYSGQAFNGDDVMPLVDLATTPKDDLLVHNEAAQPAVPFLLSRMRQPDLPEPMGILRSVEKERYVNVVRRQNEEAVAKGGEGDMQALLDGPETWTVS